MAALIRSVRARQELLCYGIAAGFGAVYLISRLRVLTRIRHNLDEGVYAFQARLIADGWTPFQDFFVHQPALYLYGLAWSGVTADLWWLRVTSVVATLATAALIIWVGRRLVSPWVGVVAGAAFLGAPLLQFGNMAMPNIWMLLAVTLAFLLMLDDTRPRIWIAAGGAIALAGFLKPLALGPALGIGVVGLLMRTWRARTLWVAFAALFVSGIFLLLSQILSGGHFFEVLSLQLRRYGAEGGFAAMLHYPMFREWVELQGVESALGWNLLEHRRSMLGPLEGNLFLLLAGLLGLARGLASPLPSERRGAALLIGWLGFAFLLSLFLWEPVWDHYFLQYLPPLALGVGMLLRRLPERDGAGSMIWAGAGVVLLGAHFAWGTSRLPVMSVGYEAAATVIPGDLPVLSLDPFLTLAAGRAPACGLIDPLNVYGEHALVARSGHPELRKFLVTADDLAVCMEHEPGMHVILSFWSDWLGDAGWQALVAEAPPDRVHRIDLWHAPP